MVEQPNHAWPRNWVCKRSIWNELDVHSWKKYQWSRKNGMWIYRLQIRSCIISRNSVIASGNETCRYWSIWYAKSWAWCIRGKESILLWYDIWRNRKSCCLRGRWAGIYWHGIWHMEYGSSGTWKSIWNLSRYEGSSCCTSLWNSG